MIDAPAFVVVGLDFDMHLPFFACSSFLPGQEAGNVDVVVESGFGKYNKRPSEIADIVTSWLQDKDLLDGMSRAAMAAGNPYAADEIVRDIGRQTVAWMKLNEQ